MGQPVFANNLYATLGVAALATDLTLTLTTGQGARFPAIAAGNWLYLTLCDPNNDLEIVKVTAVTGDVLTVQRGLDDTAPKAWAVNSRVEARFNVAYIQEMKTYITSTLDAGGYTLTGPLTLARDPVSNTMLATKRYVDNNFLNKTVPYMAPVGFPMIANGTANIMGFGWNGAIYSYVDNTNVGNLWTSSNFNPASYANTGAQCPWVQGVWENGSISRNLGSPGDGQPRTFDNGSPWVMGGMRCDGAAQFYYIRSTYLRNQ